MYTIQDMIDSCNLIAEQPASIGLMEEIVYSNLDSGSSAQNLRNFIIKSSQHDNLQKSSPLEMNEMNSEPNYQQHNMHLNLMPVSILPPAVNQSLGHMNMYHGTDSSQLDQALSSMAQSQNNLLHEYNNITNSNNQQQIENNLMNISSQSFSNNMSIINSGITVEDSVRQALAAVASHFNNNMNNNMNNPMNALHQEKETNINNLVSRIAMNNYNPNDKEEMIELTDFNFSDSRAMAVTTMGSNTGIKGISWQESRFSYQACVYISHKQIYKIFSAKKCGREKALQNAIDWLTTMRKKRDDGVSLGEMMAEGLYGRKASNTGIRGITWQQSRKKFQCSIYMDKGHRVQKYFPTGLHDKGHPRYEEAFVKAQEWMKKMEQKKMINSYGKDIIGSSKNNSMSLNTKNAHLMNGVNGINLSTLNIMRSLGDSKSSSKEGNNYLHQLVTPNRIE